MSKKHWSSTLSVLARTALAFLFVFGQTAWAIGGQNGQDKPGASSAAKSQQELANPPAATAAKAESAEEETRENPSSEENSARGGQHEGIKVHGHWMIEVRNPDGSIVTHREFENSLQPSGANTLASILGGTATPGAWAIGLSGNPSPWPQQETGNFTGIFGCDTCGIIVPNVLQFQTALHLDNNLSLNLTVNSSGTGQLVLTGSAIAPQSGTIVEVFTYLGSCGTSLTPPNCNANPPIPFTYAEFTALNLASGAAQSSVVPVSAGQTIAVTVNISFS